MEHFPNQSERQERQSQWEAKLAELSHIEDVDNFQIDEGVKEAVAVLQLLGFNTNQSCEGHNTDSPWVQFDAKQPEDIYIGERELKEKLMAEQGISVEELDRRSPKFSYEKLTKLESEARGELGGSAAAYTPEHEEWSRKTLDAAAKLKKMIDDFYLTGVSQNKDWRVGVRFPYQDPKYPPYVKDIPFVEVESVGEKVKNGSQAEEERLVILKQTQSEMNKFVEYLKELFLSAPL